MNGSAPNTTTLTNSSKNRIASPDGRFSRDEAILLPRRSEGNAIWWRRGRRRAVIGENRKLLFKLAEIPEMNRGRGVTLQKYKDGDARVYVRKEGLTWKLGEKTRTETALGDWVGQRAQPCRLPPNGFPKHNRFG
jgi:topoisomerase-4 subunit A